MILFLTELGIKSVWWTTYKLYYLGYYVMYKEYPKTKEEIILENNNKKIKDLELEIIEMKNMIKSILN